MPGNLNTPLNEKQKCLVEWNEVLHNATKAAIKAGYSSKTAKSIAWFILHKTAAIEYAQQLRNERWAGQKMFVEERWARLGEIAREDIHTEKGVPIREPNIMAIREMNRMDGIGNATVNVDARRVEWNILVADMETKVLLDKVKERTQKVLDAAVEDHTSL